jgi:hypothetical protein
LSNGSFEYVKGNLRAKTRRIDRLIANSAQNLKVLLCRGYADRIQNRILG